jgi:rhodanese-related sulfurtransferase
VLTGVVLYFGKKYFNWQRFLKQLPIARITPQELYRRMEASEDIAVFDLPHPLEFESDPETIPGAVHFGTAELEKAVDVIPRSKEAVLFCSCPDEVTAAQSALRLRNLGVGRIRPLAGGLSAWRECGFPLEQLQLRANLSDGLSAVRAD